MKPDEQGIEHGKSRYKLIPRTLILLYKNGEVLLIKGNSNKTLWANKYNGIGGHMEYGESPIESAWRELEEETGITRRDVRGFHHAGTIIINTRDQSHGIIMFVFTGESTTYKVTASVEGNLHWLDIANLKHLNLVDDIPQLISLTHAHTNDNVPFWGKYCYDENGQLNIEIRDY